MCGLRAMFTMHCVSAVGHGGVHGAGRAQTPPEWGEGGSVTSKYGSSHTHSFTSSTINSRVFAVSSLSYPIIPSSSFSLTWMITFSHPCSSPLWILTCVIAFFVSFLCFFVRLKSLFSFLFADCNEILKFNLSLRHLICFHHSSWHPGSVVSLRQRGGELWLTAVEMRFTPLRGKNKASLLFFSYTSHPSLLNQKKKARIFKHAEVRDNEERAERLVRAYAFS